MTQRVLPSKVTFFFEKRLSGDAAAVSYHANAHSGDAAITLEIENLKLASRRNSGTLVDECDLWPHNLTAKLVLFYGSDGGVLPKPTKLQGMDISRAKNEAFVYWKIDSITAIDSIASSVQRNKKVIVQVETLDIDDLFAPSNQPELLRLEVSSISLSFE